MKKIFITILVFIVSFTGFNLEVNAAELFTTALYTDANLYAYYRLEDVADSEDDGTDYDLTNYNTVPFAAAKYNNGADFGVGNSNKYLANTTAIGTVNADKSVSAWVKFEDNPFGDAGSPWEFVALGYDTNNVGYDMRYVRNGSDSAIQVRLARNREGVDNDFANCTNESTTLGTSNWYHVVFVLSSNNMTCYWNGVEASTTAINTGNGSTNTHRDGIYIGRSSIDAYYSPVIVDDVAVFTKALSSAEVLTLYNDAVTPVYEESDITWIH